MNKQLTILLFTIFILNSCNDKTKSENNLIGSWKLSKAFNSDGVPCSGLDRDKACIYNKDQAWQFKKDSLFITTFTSVANVNFGDTITLAGKYKTYKSGEDNILEIRYDKFTDTSKHEKLKIINITDTTLEYTKQKYADGSGGMRLIFKREN